MRIPLLRKRTPRMLSLRGLPPGSRVTKTRRPFRRKWEVTARSWVLFPTPSVPSSVTKIARFDTETRLSVYDLTGPRSFLREGVDPLERLLRLRSLPIFPRFRFLIFFVRRYGDAIVRAL